MNRAHLIRQALQLHELTHDPLLMDSIRVLALPQRDAITSMATANVEACLSAHKTLFGNSGMIPRDGDSTHD